MTINVFSQFEIFLTADEAFPALETLFLEANQSVSAGFRIFDPETRLRSEEGKKVGNTWADLITATLNRNVRIDLKISDFDPVVRTQLHAYTGRCIRGIRAAGQASTNPTKLNVTAMMHPARVGLLPRLVLWPRLIKEINNQLSHLNGLAETEQKQFLEDAPALQKLIYKKGDHYVARKFPPPPLVPVSHHQKLAVFDRQRLYIGGLDLNDRRFDTLAHDRPTSETWHDTQVLVDGPIAAEAAEHLEELFAATAGQTPKKTQHLLRTLSQKRRFEMPYLSPQICVTELSTKHHESAAKAQKLIYLETQFFRDSAFAERLAEQATKNPALTLILILPAAPEDIAFDPSYGSDAAYGEHLQVKAIKVLQDGFGSRCFVGAPCKPTTSTETGRHIHFDAPLIYLHAKVSIFDDRSAIVSSANLNGRSLFWDTEAGVEIDHPAHVNELKKRCFDHWLGLNADQAAYASETACDAWANIAARNAGKRPEDRSGFILPYSAAVAAEDARVLPGVPEEMV